MIPTAGIWAAEAVAARSGSASTAGSASLKGIRFRAGRTGEIPSGPMRCKSIHPRPDPGDTRHSRAPSKVRYSIMTIRRRTHLDGRWEFATDPDRSLAVDTLAGAATREIRVPGPWQAQFDDLRHYTGIAWYRLRFTVDRTAAMADPLYVIHFGAVDYHATVWRNGELLGEHEGGYLPFEFELGEALRPEASNELVVRVADPGDDVEAMPEFSFAEIPHGKQSWYGPIGGIWQSVWVEARHAVHVDRLKLTPDVA